MSEERKYGRVENYTTAFLVSAFVLVLMLLLTLWATYGFLTTLVLAWAGERAVTVSARRRRTNRL